MIHTEHKDSIINLQGAKLREHEETIANLRRSNMKLRGERNSLRARLEGLAGVARNFTEDDSVNCESLCLSNGS